MGSKQSTLTPTVGLSDMRFEWTPVGLNLYQPVLTVGGHLAPNEKRVAGVLLRRQGGRREIITTACSGGASQEALDGSDEMVLNEDYFRLVQHFAKQLRMSMGHLYDTQGGKKTVEENDEYWHCTHVEKKLATFAVVGVLRSTGYKRPIMDVNTLDFHRLQNSARWNGNPSFEIHISRTPCEMCIKFVSLLSKTTGVDMAIRIGAVMKEVTQEGAIKSPGQQRPSKEDIRKQIEVFGPVPPEWPESLRRIFTEAESSGRHLPKKTSNSAPVGQDGFQDQEPSHEAALPFKDSEKSRCRDTDKSGMAQTDNNGTGPSDEGANHVKEEDDDFQMINGYEFYHPNTPYPSIESVSGRRSHRTATTPDGSALPVSPRTDMYIRSRRYDGPTYMPGRERSVIDKPVATPITTTPSDIRRKYPTTTDRRGKRKRGRNDVDQGRKLSGLWRKIAVEPMR